MFCANLAPKWKAKSQLYLSVRWNPWSWKTSITVKETQSKQSRRHSGNFASILNIEGKKSIPLFKDFLKRLWLESRIMHMTWLDLGAIPPTLRNTGLFRRHRYTTLLFAPDAQLMQPTSFSKNLYSLCWHFEQLLLRNGSQYYLVNYQQIPDSGVFALQNNCVERVMETFAAISCVGCSKQGIIEIGQTLAIFFCCQLQCPQHTVGYVLQKCCKGHATSLLSGNVS